MGDHEEGNKRVVEDVMGWEYLALMSWLVTCGGVHGR